MSLFKRAFVRGVNDELIRHGHVRYVDKYAADETADAVADLAEQQGAMPEPAAESVPPEVVADVATTLVDAANKLISSTGVSTEAPSAEEEALKTSAAQDLSTRAAEQAYSVMVKAAEETKQALGSTIEGGDKGNTATDAPAAETQMENKNRPQGEHTDSRGTTDLPQTGAVGKEQDVDKGPHNSPAGENSVTEASKTSALRDAIRKFAAAGSTIMGGDKGNTLPQAAAVTGEGQLALKNQPMGYATNSRGTTSFQIPPAAVVGTEQPHPKMFKEHPAGNNSVTKMSQEDPFLVLFRKTASEVGPFLPNMDEDTKIAHVRRMMGMDDSERHQYLAMMYKDAGATDDQAVELVTKMAAHVQQKRAADESEPKSNFPFMTSTTGKDEEKKEEKKEESEEKKEDEKKEGMDLLSRIRQISQK